MEGGEQLRGGAGSGKNVPQQKLEVQSHHWQRHADDQTSRQKKTPNSRQKADILETELGLVLGFGFSHTDSREKGTPRGV